MTEDQEYREWVWWDSEVRCPDCGTIAIGVISEDGKDGALACPNLDCCYAPGFSMALYSQLVTLHWNQQDPTDPATIAALKQLGSEGAI